MDREGKALFAEILVNTDHNFLLTLEKLALKCLSNYEVFSHIKNLFQIALQDSQFIAKKQKVELHR